MNAYQALRILIAAGMSRADVLALSQEERIRRATQVLSDYGVHADRARAEAARLGLGGEPQQPTVEERALLSGGGGAGGDGGGMPGGEPDYSQLPNGGQGFYLSGPGTVVNEQTGERWVWEPGGEMTLDANGNLVESAGRWVPLSSLSQWQMYGPGGGGGGQRPHAYQHFEDAAGNIYAFDPNTGQPTLIIEAGGAGMPPLWSPIQGANGELFWFVPDEDSPDGFRREQLAPPEEPGTDFLGRAGDSLAFMNPDGTVRYEPIPPEYLIAEAPTPIEMAKRMMAAGETDLGKIQQEVTRRFGQQAAAGMRPMTGAEQQRGVQSQGVSFQPGAGLTQVRPAAAPATRTLSEYGEFMYPYRMVQAAQQALEAGTLPEESGLGRAARGLPVFPEEEERPEGTTIGGQAPTGEEEPEGQSIGRRRRRRRPEEEEEEDEEEKRKKRRGRMGTTIGGQTPPAAPSGVTVGF